MKVAPLIAVILVISLLWVPQSADTQELRPEIRNTSVKKPTDHTSSNEILSGNPIKLTVTKDDLSSELPRLDEPLALSDAIKLGLKNNLDFLASKEEWSGSKYLARAALARFGPQASFSTFYSSSSISQMLFFMERDISPAPMQPIERGNSLHLLFTGYQPIFTGGRLLGGYKAARAIERQTLAAYQSDRIKAVLAIKEAYWKAAWDLAKLQVSEDYVKYRKWSVGLMEARYKQGKVPRAELLREQAELAKAQQIVNSGFRDYNTSLLDLKVAMGVNIGSQINLKDELKYVAIGQEYPFYLNEAQRNRPEIMQADSKVKEKMANYKIARSQYAPQVGAYGLASNATGRTPGVSESVNGRWGGTIGVVGGITLFDSGKRFNELRAAKVAIRQSEIDRRNVHLNVAKEVSQAWIELDVARRNVSLAEAEVASAKEDERLFYRRYQVGKAIELDYFVSGVRYFEASLRLQEVIYDYRVAEAKLVWSSGNV
ncbi:MAG: TolC family protein [Candidatus Obscuribacterales bacterium]|nr:TolC family protein [Candidatus Obscuribacterales bacterium]